MESTTFLDFTADVFKYVTVEYLNGYDLLSLYYAGYIDIDVLKNHLINKIIFELKIIFGKNYNEFLELMKTGTIGITGSFILGIINGKYYDGDVDICCYNNLYSRVNKLVISMGCKNMKYKKNYIVKHTKFAIKNNYIDSIIEGSLAYHSCLPDINIYEEKNDTFVECAVRGMNLGYIKDIDTLLNDENFYKKYKNYKEKVDNFSSTVLPEHLYSIRDKIDLDYLPYHDDLKGNTSKFIICGKEEIKVWTKSKRLQFIFIKGNNFDNYLNTFDIDVCKNILFYKDGNFTLNIDNIINIFNNEMEIKIVPSLDGERLRKYISRGFNIKADKSHRIEILRHILKQYNCDRTVIHKTEIFDKVYDKEIYNEKDMDCDLCYCKMVGLEHIHVIPKKFNMEEKISHIVIL